MHREEVLAPYCRFCFSVSLRTLRAVVTPNAAADDMMFHDFETCRDSSDVDDEMLPSRGLYDDDAAW
jgi:hypothetical protein